MIEITDKHNCCGCSSCVHTCSRHCISFDVEDHGFCYPKVDKKSCVDCGLCETVCPMINRKEKVSPLWICAAVNTDDDIRSRSSSGGIFTLLAEQILSEGGVVFGASFNDKWEVVHCYVENISDLECLRGSKYSQSVIGDTYKQVQEFLKEGRKVLFSGTGCQVAGLKLYLHKEYENLLNIEIACHGVPSPKVWGEYVKKVSNGKRLNSIMFRDKRKGWNSYGLSCIEFNGKELMYEKATDNDYMQSFLNCLSLRPSCANCPVKAGASGADILLGDFWGVESLYPEIYDNKGCSLVIAYTMKGKKMLESLDCHYVETTYEDAYRYNPCIVSSSHESRYAPIFWNNFSKYGIESLPLTLRVLRSGRIKRAFSLFIYKMFHL